MNYTENFEGIKLDVQAVDIAIDEQIQQRIRDILTRLLRRTDKINFADVYLEDKKGKLSDPKKVSIRLGIPGPDVFASEYGDSFPGLLDSVARKLEQQLERR